MNFTCVFDPGTPEQQAELAAAIELAWTALEINDDEVQE